MSNSEGHDPSARGVVGRVALAFAIVGVSCSSSVLVRPDDATFARGQRRLATTMDLVQQQDAPQVEKTLMVEAEALYRYRFDPPPRGFVSYAAEFAASAIEIPALQSMSGSLDIVDLRLKTSDGAVHLWETFLARYPQSRMRSLVLYRLGWAYRSTGATGLPRRSGDEAFDLLLTESPRSPLGALALEAKKLPGKSKDAATGWSIVPGLGQMYLGQYGRGAVYVAIAAAAVTLMVAPVVVAYQRRHDLTWGRDWPLLAAGVGGIVFLSLGYTVAYQDAVRGVVEWNERIENAFDDTHPEAP
jgi:hypothetical protein